MFFLLLVMFVIGLFDVKLLCILLGWVVFGLFVVLLFGGVLVVVFVLCDY